MSHLQTISIVTPSYQHRKFIESTLESVLRQAGDFHLDYIVVDGGSTDGTVELLQQYDERIRARELPIACRSVSFRWVSERDRGQANAVNKGFRLAQGEVLAWLNSDDTYADDRVLSRCLEHFSEHPESHFLYGRGYGISTQGSVIREEAYVVEYPIELLPEIDMVLQPSSFWRRGVYETVGDLNEEMHFAFDWEYWLRIREHYSMDFLDSFLSCNRLHESTKTATGGIKRKREIACLLLERGSFTERSVQAYLAAPLAPEPSKQLPPDPPVVPAVAQPEPNVVQPFPTEMGRRWCTLRQFMRTLLAPTREIERQIRRVRKRRLVRMSTEA